MPAVMNKSNASNIWKAINQVWNEVARNEGSTKGLSLNNIFNYINFNSKFF